MNSMGHRLYPIKRKKAFLIFFVWLEQINLRPGCWNLIITRQALSIYHEACQYHNSPLLADPPTNFADVGRVCECVSVCVRMCMHACVKQPIVCQIVHKSAASPVWGPPFYWLLSAWHLHSWVSLHGGGGVSWHCVICLVFVLDFVCWQSKSLNSWFITSVNF